MTHSPLATPSATRAVLAAHGLATKKSLGQHFLVDDNVVGRILSLAAISPDDVVLEVGPGIGTLTVALCATGAQVLSIERDADLLPALADTTAGCERLDVLRADALGVPASSLVTPAGPPTAFVANLPYQVAATLVLRFFAEVPSLRSATIMVQAEVADRMAAKPGGKDYGAYTVKLQLLAKPAGRIAVGRGVFMPPPRVDSAVLRLERVSRPEAPALVEGAAQVAVAAFAQRRKTLRNSLLASGKWSSAVVDEALERAGIEGRRRAETLSVDDFIRLAGEMR